MSENLGAMKDDALLNTDASFNRFNDAYVKYLWATEKHKHFLLILNSFYKVLLLLNNNLDISN